MARTYVRGYKCSGAFKGKDSSHQAGERQRRSQEEQTDTHGWQRTGCSELSNGGEDEAEADEAGDDSEDEFDEFFHFCFWDGLDLASAIIAESGGRLINERESSVVGQDYLNRVKPTAARVLPSRRHRPQTNGPVFQPR